MNGFENFLNKKDLYFSYESFMLFGNIKKIKDDSILQKKEIPTLINNFFREYAISLKLIDGSKKILKELSKLINIVILTNMPTEYVHKRVQALENNEMFYYVISNTSSFIGILANIFSCFTYGPNFPIWAVIIFPVSG